MLCYCDLDCDLHHTNVHYFYSLFKTFTPKLVLLDFSDMESISEMITEIEESYGCVDVLICNSSMKVKAPVQNLSLDMDKTIMDVNYFGPITLAKGRRSYLKICQQSKINV